MPRIPRTEATARVQLTNQPTMPTDLLTGPGRALQGLGKSISGLADDFASMSGPSDQDVFNAQMASLQSEQAADRYVAERMAGVTGETDVDAWRHETDSGVASIMQQHREKIAHPKLQMRYDINAQQFQGRFQAKTHGLALETTVQRNVEGAAATFATEIARTQANDPKLVQILDTIDQQIGRIPGASPAQQAMVRNQAAAAALQKMQESAAKDPVGAVDTAKQIIETWGKELEAKPQPGPPGQGQQVGPQSSVDMQDFTSGRRFAALPADNVRNIVLHDVSGDPSNRRLPRGGNIPNYHITFDEKGIYNEIALDQRAPHAASFNKNSIGIAHIGFEDDKLSPQAIANGAKAVKMVADRFGVSPENILTHPGAGPSATKSGGKDPKEASWRTQVLAYIDQNMGGLGGGTATAAKDGLKVDLTAYSPRAGGDKMEGGYEAARPGPDGKAEVRTLADFAAGRSKYVTLAGNPRDYGKTYVIPEITFVDASGNRQTLKNVEGVVHDTGSAFKDAPEGRFDIPIDKDATDRQMAASHTMWKKAGIQFVEKGKDEPTPMAERGIAQYAGSVKVADASGAVPQSAQGGQRATNTIPGAQQAQAMSPTDWNRAQREAQDAARPGTIPGIKAAGGPQWARPSIRTEIIERLAKELPALEQARVKALDGLVKRAEDSAGSGYLLPEAERLSTIALIRRAGTPQMMERFANAEAAAAMTVNMKQMTPAQINGQVAMLRQAMNTAGASPETIAKAKAVEALQARMTKELSDNSVGWAAEAGIIPAQVAITPRSISVDVLRQRAQAVSTIAQHYGPEFKQFFTREEKETLEADFKQGGDRMLTMMGMMYDAFGDDMPRAVSEIAPKDPEAVRAGYLLAGGGDPGAAKDIAATIQRRSDPNYKAELSLKGLMTNAEADANEVLSDVYRNFPKQVRDATMRAAEAIYMARVKDPKTYDAELFRQSLHLAMGGRVNQAGKEFGGVVQTTPGAVWGKSGGAIVLPTDMRKDLWRETLDSITIEDLKKANHPLPVDANGTPLRITQALNGNLVQTDVGKYAVALGDPNTKGAEKWVYQGSAVTGAKSDAAAPLKPNEPFVLDMKKLTPILRNRMPEAFWTE